MNIAVVANTSWYLFNFRSNLMSSLRAQGHQVIALGQPDGYEVKLQAQGVETRPIDFDGGGVNPVRQFKAILQTRRALADNDVDLILSYTPKGNLYASLAAAMTGRSTKQIVNISGLGRAFVEVSWLTHIVKILYKFSLGRADWIFFQNEEDMAAFLGAGLANPAKCDRLPGSGVDLQRFNRASCEPPSEPSADSLTFLMVARMLWDKGVGQFVEAARAIRSKYPQTRFQLLGAVQDNSAACVSTHQMNEWVAEGVVEYLGVTDDIRKYLCRADCAVLPSYYREGVPRSLLEAAAMSLPIVTTDSTGCRDTVEDGVSGLLCEPRSSEDLARAMVQMVTMSPAQRRAMGDAGRARMERKFSEQVVIDKYLRKITELSC